MSKSIEPSKDERKSKTFLVVFFLLTIFCIVFGILSLSNTKYFFLVEHFLFFAILISVIFSIFYAITVWAIVKRKETIVKLFLSVYIFLSFCLLLIFILQSTGFFQMIKDADSLQAYLEQSGAWMPLLYILLQYLQVVILPIPSVISTVAGVALFGAFKAALYSLIGIFLGSLTAFFIGRKLGKKAVIWLIGEETLEKWQKKLKGKDNLFLSLMFILPLFPDDILCFLAGLSSMSVKFFLIIISVSRITAITGTCYSIDFIPFNTWWGLLIWGFFIIALVILFILVYKNLDKIQRWVKELKNKQKK